MRISFAALCLIVAVVAHPHSEDKLEMREFKKTDINTVQENPLAKESIELAEVPTIVSAWHADATEVFDGTVR